MNRWKELYCILTVTVSVRNKTTNLEEPHKYLAVW